MPRKSGDIEITNIQTGVKMGAQGTPNRVITTEFRIRGQGPFSVVSPIEGYSAAVTREQVESLADEIISTMEMV